MARLTRVTAVPFGLTGTTDDFETFGSTAAGGADYSKDPAAIQATDAWSSGWRTALIANKAPVLQDMNGFCLVDSRQIAYTLQEGIPEYDATTTYNVGSVVKIPYTGTSQGAKLFISLIDANVGNALPTAPASNSNWQYCGDLTQNPQLFSYRRPNLVYASSTTVTLETGLDGNGSGRAVVMFPDGQTLAISSAGLITLDITRVASLGGSPQSGLDTGTVANNTWYHVYAVKANSGASYVLVATLNEPVQANFSTLNSNFGSGSWVFLGSIRYGDQGATANAILAFEQDGPFMYFNNINTGGSNTPGPGILLATQASGTSVTWTYASGNGGAVVPTRFKKGLLTPGVATANGTFNFFAQTSSNRRYAQISGSSVVSLPIIADLKNGFSLGAGTSTALDIYLTGYWDPALGIASNPLL